MGLTGKYDFKNISKLNALGFKALLASFPYTAWLLKGGKVLDLFLELLGNLAANKGLVVFNLGAIYVDGEVDQKVLDRAIENGWKQIETQGRENITEEQGRAIDEAVRKAADKFIPLSYDKRGGTKRP